MENITMSSIDLIDSDFSVSFANKFKTEFSLPESKVRKFKDEMHFEKFLFSYEIKFMNGKYFLGLRLNIYDENDFFLTKEIAKRLSFLFYDESALLIDGYFACIESKIQSEISSDFKEQLLEEFADLIDRVKIVLDFHFERSFLYLIVPNVDLIEEERRVKEIEKLYYQYLEEPTLRKGIRRNVNRNWLQKAYVLLRNIGIF